MRAHTFIITAEQLRMAWRHISRPGWPSTLEAALAQPAHHAALHPRVVEAALDVAQATQACAEGGGVGHLVATVQRRSLQHVGMICRMVDARVDGLLQVAGHGVLVVECLGGDAHVAAVAVRVADGDLVLLFHRQREEVARFAQHVGLGLCRHTVILHQDEASVTEGVVE